MSEKRKNPEGWPLTDPYPYHGQDKWPPQNTEKADCAFVERHKAGVAEELADEGTDREYYLDLAWAEINSISAELKRAKDHVKWLETLGGEVLQMNCGFDIMCRAMSIEKLQAAAEDSDSA